MLLVAFAARRQNNYPGELKKKLNYRTENSAKTMPFVLSRLLGLPVSVLLSKAVSDRLAINKIQLRQHACSTVVCRPVDSSTLRTPMIVLCVEA